MFLSVLRISIVSFSICLQTITFSEKKRDYWTVTFLKRGTYQCKKSATPSHFLLSKFLMLVLSLRSTGWDTNSITDLSSTRRSLCVQSDTLWKENRRISVQTQTIRPKYGFPDGKFWICHAISRALSKFGAHFVIRFLTIPYSTFLKTEKLYVNQNALLIPFNNGFALKFTIYWKSYNKKLAFWGGIR